MRLPITFRAALIALALLSTACAPAIVRPAASPARPNADALLVLPGFGYGPAGGRAFRALAAAMAAEGIDLYVPAYVTRSGLADTRAKLERFIRDKRLNQYQRLHVFAYIAGGWTLNPLADRLPNLATVIYDRSPFQERAPRIAADDLRLLAWLRYGRTVFDVARTPYVPFAAPNVNVALMIESAPTSFIKRHEKEALRYGPFEFACDAFGQRYDDCLYLPLNHDQMYEQFADVWPDVLAFIRTGRFDRNAQRTPPADPLAWSRAR
jgi:hypothetical protein